jgi:hypothetical protein
MAPAGFQTGGAGQFQTSTKLDLRRPPPHKAITAQPGDCPPIASEIRRQVSRQSSVSSHQRLSLDHIRILFGPGRTNHIPRSRTSSTRGASPRFLQDHIIPASLYFSSFFDPRRSNICLSNRLADLSSPFRPLHARSDISATSWLVFLGYSFQKERSRYSRRAEKSLTLFPLAVGIDSCPSGRY